ncbi:hypothetical protein [Falsiruegeria mediterranea]|uniref:Uncharacterized protein n=1 Tax=Falsiruegeria mediterranea M17 TaxID=1200281 RepID=A0A2R8C7W7_9RHOB|nr:hypothetical protein [Falsiruegeria mediterranea]SPJ28521.1 hypothetical protein TRM7615_02021 [Falsiruegeria mediterranea M17]
MFFRIILCATLALSAAPTLAQQLNTLAKNSEFIEEYLSYMKSKNVKSVYASTKPYCPSLFWWSSRPSANKDAKRAFRNDLARRMQAVGFTNAEVEHCVENSGFVMENRALTDHPKNAAYNNRVQAAFMMVRDLSTGSISEAPALIETNSYDDRSWDVFDRRFTKQCSFGTTPSQKSVDMTCKNFGKLKGYYQNEGNDRFTLVVHNARYQIVYLTRRTPSYARSKFEKLVERNN